MITETDKVAMKNNLTVSESSSSEVSTLLKLMERVEQASEATSEVAAQMEQQMRKADNKQESSRTDDETQNAHKPTFEVRFEDMMKQFTEQFTYVMMMRTTSAPEKKANSLPGTQDQRPVVDIDEYHACCLRPGSLSWFQTDKDDSTDCVACDGDNTLAVPACTSIFKDVQHYVFDDDPSEMAIVYESNWLITPDKKHEQDDEMRWADIHDEEDEGCEGSLQLSGNMNSDGCTGQSTLRSLAALTCAKKNAKKNGCTGGSDDGRALDAEQVPTRNLQRPQPIMLGDWLSRALVQPKPKQPSTMPLQKTKKNKPKIMKKNRLVAS